MTRKKSKFLTFCCSLVPGAGEMYLGFLKQGVSIMGLFLLIYILGGIIFPPAVTFCSVIWFYSFFHTHNLNSLPDDEFYAIEDGYILHFRQIVKGRDVLLNQHRRLFAVVLILLGASMIWNNINDFLSMFVYDLLELPSELQDMFHWFTNSLPRTVVSLAIIASGFYLIRDKKKELDYSNPSCNKEKKNS